MSKSLVLAEPTSDGPIRYQILETLRQYGRERLDGTGQADRARAQHAAYYLSLAEAAVPKLRGPQQDAWLVRLEQEHDNFRAALAWSRSPAGDHLLGVRLAGALGWFWYIHGHLSEARRQITAALATATDAPADARARALGMAAFWLGSRGSPRFLKNSSRRAWSCTDRWVIAEARGWS